MDSLGLSSSSSSSNSYFASFYSYFNFYIVVILVGIVLLILILVYVGWLMQYQNAGAKFPSDLNPVIPIMPDNWAPSIDISGGSIIPPNKSPNTGTIYDPTGNVNLFITDMIATFPTMVIQYKDNSNIIQTINASNLSGINIYFGKNASIIFPTDPCILHKWAIRYNILWNGISNYVSTACTVVPTI